MASDPGLATSVLQLRIALRGLSPPVWRRVLVPEHLTLTELHNVSQVVMGWADESAPVQHPWQALRKREIKRT
ncbi:IS1096 element passenger TnpR family protein [Cupriavidus necator]